MALEITAQELVVVDPGFAPEHSYMEEPIEVSMPAMIENDSSNLEIIDQPSDDIVITLSDIPGAPVGTKDPEPELEVSEEIKEDDSKKEDENDAKSKKNEKWDWTKRGPTGFVVWIKERFEDVPKHSGYDTSGVQRALAYLEKVDGEISKAMRLDVDGELDADKIEEIRSKIEDGIQSLHDRLAKINKSKKPNKKRSDYIQEGIVKTANVPGVKGIFITVDLLTSRIARACINGMISSGKDIESLFDIECKKYKLNERERACVVQLILDMGLAINEDRIHLTDEDYDQDESEFIQQFKG